MKNQWPHLHKLKKAPTAEGTFRPITRPHQLPLEQVDKVTSKIQNQLEFPHQY